MQINSNFTWDILTSWPEFKAPYIEAQNNPVVSIRDIMKFAYPLWTGVKYSSYSGITDDILEEFPNYRWNFHLLSRYAKISKKYILQNWNKPWDMLYICAKDIIEWEDVLSNPHINWCYSGLSANPNITWEIVLKHPNLPWSYTSISINPNIDINIVVQNLDKPWDFDMLSCNTNITLLDIKKYQNLPWNMITHCRNNYTFMIYASMEDLIKYKGNYTQNEGLYNDNIYYKELVQDIHIRKKEVIAAMNEYINKDISIIVNKYINYI